MPKFPSKRAIAIGATALVVAGGGGAAVAATGSGSSPNDFLDSVARHLGISRQKLDDATKAAAIDQVDAQLKAGQITQAQADELKKRIQDGDVPPLGGLGAQQTAAFERVARAHGATPHQIALAYLLRRSPVIAPIPGTASIAHLEENIAAAEIKLSERDREELDRMGR